MRIRSLTQLTQYLEEELAWRKRELTTLRFMLGSRREHERHLLLRAALCVLYAHWEGFIRAAATGYLSYVATQGLRFIDLTPNFVALGLRSAISQAGQSNRPSVHTALTTRLMLGLSEPASIDWENSVETRSNLGSENLNEILCLLGLDNESYRSKQPLLDKKLLEKRNLIAHGRQTEIELDDYFGLHDEIVQLVEHFRTDVENAAALENYRAVPVSEV